MTTITAMTEERADEILEASPLVQDLLVRLYHSVNSGRIVYRNGRVMLSYHQTEAKATAGIRTIAKLQGKLQALLGMSEQEAKEKVDSIQSLLSGESTTLHITLTQLGKPEHIALLDKVYRADLRNYRGTASPNSSCMNHGIKTALRYEDKNGNAIFPALAYNNPSITLATIHNGAEIVGRSITATHSKCFYSVYTANYETHPIALALLEKAGLTQEGNALKGCHLVTVVNDDNEVLMPYLDGNYDHADYDADAYSDGELVNITHSTGYSCKHSTGTPEGFGRQMFICACCGDRAEGEEYYTVDGVVCEHCYQTEYTYAYTGRYHESVNHCSEPVYFYNDEAYTEDGLAWHDLVIVKGDVQEKADCVYSENNHEWILLEDSIYCPLTGEYKHPDDCSDFLGLTVCTDERNRLTDENLTLLSVINYNYSHGEPTEEQAEALLDDLLDSDAELCDNERQDAIDAILELMLEQYIKECEQYRIVEQYRLAV